VVGWKELMHGQPPLARQVDEGRGPFVRHETEVGLTLQPFEIAVLEGP
jgi:hypothetical protein